MRFRDAIWLWLRESALAYGFFGPLSTEDLIDTWAEKSAQICSPDQLIVAGIIESVAKEYPDWQFTDLKDATLVANGTHQRCSITRRSFK